MQAAGANILLKSVAYNNMQLTEYLLLHAFLVKEIKDIEMFWLFFLIFIAEQLFYTSFESGVVKRAFRVNTYGKCFQC